MKRIRFWLLLWTANNISVTLINKAAFSVVHFPYPYALTAIHMAVSWLCCQGIFYSVQQQQQQHKESSSKPNFWVRLLGDDLLLPPPTKHNASSIGRNNGIGGGPVIWAFSVLFTLNIAIGNVSLQHVSVNFNQVLRSLVPVFTLWFSLLLGSGAKISVARRRSVWPVVLGVAMAAFGDRMSVTVAGFVYTLACVVLASLKVVVSSELLTGSGTAATGTTSTSTTTGSDGSSTGNGVGLLLRQYTKMHPVRLLQLMAPLALAQCVALSVLTGEAAQLGRQWSTDLNPFLTHTVNGGGGWNGRPVAVLLLSGVLAFSLNICALQAYKLTSALTCCIAAAVKQVLMIVVGTALFRTPITRLNGAGIAVVLIGSAYYSYVSMVVDVVDKNNSTQKTPQAVTDSNMVTTDEENFAQQQDDDEGVPLIESAPAATNNDRRVVARR